MTFHDIPNSKTLNEKSKAKAEEMQDASPMLHACEGGENNASKTSRDVMSGVCLPSARSLVEVSYRGIGGNGRS